MDIKGVFKAAAPFLSAAIGLPVGNPVVRIAASVLTKATGTEVKPESIGDVLTDLASTEEGRLKIQESEQQYQLACRQLNFKTATDLEELANADRASARDREKTVKDKTPAILAAIITIGFFFMLWLVAVHGVHPGSETLCNVMLGSLGTAWLAVVYYYFGSSSGSAEKTALLAKAPAVQP